MMNRLVVVFILFSIISITACQRAEYNDTDLTVFKYNEAAGITSLDPAFARNQANIWVVNQLFNGLVQLDSNLQIKPCIAARWEVSSDAGEFTFFLRTDVYFHDSEVFPNKKGRKVIAGDVVYSLQRLSNSRLASPGAWIMNHVDGPDGNKNIIAINDSVVRIKLKQPFPPFIGMLSMQYCSIIPREAVEYYGEEFRVNPVGTGPFTFKMLKEGVKLVMIRNPMYFELDDNGNKLPYLDAISVSFIIDKQSAFLEFVKGNLDFMSGLDASYKDEVLSPSGQLKSKYRDRIRLISQPYLNTEYLGILYDQNNPIMENSPLKDIRVRKALNMGFDRKRMIRYLRNGIGQPGIHGIIPAGMPGYSEDSNYGYTYNPALASQLLTEAGYPGGKGLPPITISTNASYLDISQFIQNQLSQIGFNIKIDVSPPGTLRENIAQGRVAFFRGSWIADYPDAENYLSLFYSENKSPAGPNYTQFENKEFDQLYLKAIHEPNDSIRIGLYQQMDSVMMEQSPVIVLFYDQVLRFTGKSIYNLGSNPLNLLDLKRVRKLNNKKSDKQQQHANRK
jgi:oligopeptide transport system substrate-binding protein